MRAPTGNVVCVQCSAVHRALQLKSDIALELHQPMIAQVSFFQVAHAHPRARMHSHALLHARRGGGPSLWLRCCCGSSWCPSRRPT
jgi:hypothetical protein